MQSDQLTVSRKVRNVSYNVGFVIGHCLGYSNCCCWSDEFIGTFSGDSNIYGVVSGVVNLHGLCWIHWDIILSI